MKHIFITLAALGLATSAHAECASVDQTFLSCTIKPSGKLLSVCLENGKAIYRFGPRGNAEITLSQSFEQVDYRPWNGVGSSIWEEVRFVNGGVTYAVHGLIRRIAADSNDGPNLDGGVEVLRGEESLAQLSCLQTSVVFPWNEKISDAKHAAGLMWDNTQQSWRPAPD